MKEFVESLLIEHSLVTAFAVIGVLMWISYWLSDQFTRGRLHGSAIAIFLGLVLALIGGCVTGGKKGIADIPALAGIGLLGGAMLRDFAIVATAMGVHLEELRSTGLAGVLSLLTGVFVSFAVGVAQRRRFGIRRLECGGFETFLST